MPGVIKKIKCPGINCILKDQGIFVIVDFEVYSKSYLSGHDFEFS